MSRAAASPVSVACVYLVETRRGEGLAVDAAIAVVHEELARVVGGGVGPIVEPEQHAVVIDAQGYQFCGVRISALVVHVPCSVESVDNLAVVDPVEGSEVHRRLAVRSFP